jgi:hypothetical protein
MLEVCNATVRLAGSVAHTVPKVGLTVPEVVVLRALHASDAVVDIVPTHTIERDAREEKNRLAGIYGDKQIEAIFPGYAPEMPKTFKAIGHEQPYEVLAPLPAAPEEPEEEEVRNPLAGTPKRAQRAA